MPSVDSPEMSNVHPLLLLLPRFRMCVQKHSSFFILNGSFKPFSQTYSTCLTKSWDRHVAYQPANAPIFFLVLKSCLKCAFTCGLWNRSLKRDQFATLPKYVFTEYMITPSFLAHFNLLPVVCRNEARVCFSYLAVRMWVWTTHHGALILKDLKTESGKSDLEGLNVSDCMWSNKARLQNSCDKTGVKLKNTNIKCFPKAHLSFQLVLIIREVIVVLMRKKKAKTCQKQWG